MAAISETMRLEIQSRIANPDTSDEDRRALSIALIANARAEGTQPDVAERILEQPIAAPAGRQEELLAAGQEAVERQPDVPRLGFEQPPQDAQQRAERELSTRGFARGAFQRVVQVYDFFRRGVLDDTEQAEVADQRREQNAEAAFSLLEDAAALGIENGKIFRDIGVGEFAPDIAMSLIPAMAARTIAGRIAGDTILGGILFGSTVELDEDAMMLTAAGALGSGALGLLTEVPGMGRQVIAGDVNRALRNKFGDLRNVPENPFLPTEAAQVTGIQQTIGETTANSRVLGLESEVQARKSVAGAAETFNKQREAIAISAYARIVTALDPEKISAAVIIDTIDVARRRAVTAIGETASEVWRDTIRPSLQGIGAKFGPRGQIVGGRRIIQTKTLRDELRKIMAETETPVLADRTRQRWAQNTLSQLDGLGDTLTIGEYQLITKGLGEGAITDGVFVNTKAMQQALRADLDLTRSASGGDRAVVAVIDGLDDANAQFAARMAPAEEVNSIFVAKLGIEDAGLSPEEFVKNFDSLPPSQKKKVFDTLHAFDPALSRQLSGKIFSETVRRNRVLSSTTEFLDGPTDVIDIASLALDMAKGSADDIRMLINAPGLDETQTKLITAAFDQLNKLKGTPNVTRVASGGGFGVQRAKEYLINAVSRDSGFVSRLLAGEMTPGALERWLFTEKGLNALMDVGRVGLRPGKGGTLAAGISAMRILFDLDAENDKSRDALERRIVAARNKQASEQVTESAAFR